MQSKNLLSKSIASEGQGRLILVYPSDPTTKLTVRNMCIFIHSIDSCLLYRHPVQSSHVIVDMRHSRTIKHDSPLNVKGHRKHFENYCQKTHIDAKLQFLQK